MKKVYQTDLSPTTGNCFQACVASILELNLESIPHFMDEYTEENKHGWWHNFNEWLQSNLNMVSINENLTDEHRETWLKFLKDINCYTLAGIECDNGLHHAVVLKGDKIVHNPWPSYEGNFDEKIIDVQFLIPMNPANCIRG